MTTPLPHTRARRGRSALLRTRTATPATLSGCLALGGLATLLLALLGACAGGAGHDEAPATDTATVADADAYRADIAQWHQEREAGLRRPEGWLTLVGLYWLDPGVNDLGADPMSDVVLPAQAPTRVGSVTLADDGTLTLDVAPGVDATIDDKPVRQAVLTPDVDGEPNQVALGTLRFYAIRRGDWYGLRVRDLASPALKSFQGVDTFPVDPKYRVEARFEPFDAPQTLEVDDVTGNTQTMTSPGVLHFTLDGKDLSLQVAQEDPAELFLIFADATSGKETYGAGRYLDAAAPDADGKVVVDFNKAYNPPCAFTPYATCPLPPKQNRLPVRIEAGEKVYRGPGAH